jgi:hypothetical protein
MKHTPGPWYEANTGNHQGLVISESSSADVCVTYDKQDAALIAAAPEMLEAIELIHGYAVVAMMSNTLGRANKLEQIRVLSAAIISKVENR